MKLISDELYQLLVDSLLPQTATDFERSKELGPGIDVDDRLALQLQTTTSFTGHSISDLLMTGAQLVREGYEAEDSHAFLGSCRVGRYGTVRVRRVPIPQTATDRERFAGEAELIYEEDMSEYELNNPGSTAPWDELTREQQDEYVWRSKRQAEATS